MLNKMADGPQTTQSISENKHSLSIDKNAPSMPIDCINDDAQAVTLGDKVIQTQPKSKSGHKWPTKDAEQNNRSGRWSASHTQSISENKHSVTTTRTHRQCQSSVSMMRRWQQHSVI